MAAVTKPDDMRIGDAERDAVTSALHEHFAAGRLDQEELEQRLDAALAAKTQGDLKGILRDLPGEAGPPEPVKERRPGHARHHGRPARRHRHGAVLPLLIMVFLVVTFTAGASAAVGVVLKLALVFVIVKVLITMFRGACSR